MFASRWVQSMIVGTLLSLALAGRVAIGADPPVAAAPAIDPLRQWAQWRGPLGTGVAPLANPPAEWSEDKNVRWKIEIPGLGHSTPIVWGDRVFLTAAIPIGEELTPKPSAAPGAHDNLPVTRKQRFVALAIARSDGKILWERTLREQLPIEQGHYTASLASNSPVTDGERLYFFFGSHGLYCLDFEGQELWRRDFGLMQSLHGHGEGSSPVLFRDFLIVNWDHEGQSFVTALDKRAGEDRWRIDRREVTSWASPIVVERNGLAQVIVSGTNRVRGYGLEKGDILWECGGLSANVVASPVSSGGFVYAGSSYDVKALMAIPLEGAQGKVEPAWRRARGTPYVPSPLLYEDSLYFLQHYQGILTRIHGPSGEDRPGAFRLVGIHDVYASPVAAAGRIYVTDRDGATIVISHADEPKPLAFNRLDDRFSSSPAIVDDEMFLRGEKWLYCLGAPRE